MSLKFECQYCGNIFSVSHNDVYRKAHSCEDCGETKKLKFLEYSKTNIYGYEEEVEAEQEELNKEEEVEESKSDLETMGELPPFSILDDFQYWTKARRRGLDNIDALELYENEDQDPILDFVD